MNNSISVLVQDCEQASRVSQLPIIPPCVCNPVLAYSGDIVAKNTHTLNKYAVLFTKHTGDGFEVIPCSGIRKTAETFTAQHSIILSQKLQDRKDRRWLRQ